MSSTVKKHNPEDIQGWNHDSALDHDQDILFTITNSKLTSDILPTISLNQPFKSDQITQRYSEIKQLANKKKIIKSNRQFGKKIEQDLSPLKHKLLSILYEEDQNIKSTNTRCSPLPPQLDPHFQFYPPHGKVKSYSKLPNHKKINPLHTKIKTIIEDKKIDKEKDSKVDKYKRNDTCKRSGTHQRTESHQNIRNYDIATGFRRYKDSQRFEQSQLKRSEQHLKGSPTKLSSVNHSIKSMKDQLKEVKIPNINKKKSHSTSINTQEYRIKKKKYEKAKLERIEKANQKLQSTFFKQDLYYLQKKKQERRNKILQALQFSDQQIFNNHNSIHNLCRITPPLKQIAMSQKLQPKKGKVSLHYKLVVY